MNEWGRHRAKKRMMKRGEFRELSANYPTVEHRKVVSSYASLGRRGSVSCTIRTTFWHRTARTVVISGSRYRACTQRHLVLININSSVLHLLRRVKGFMESEPGLLISTECDAAVLDHWNGRYTTLSGCIKTHLMENSGNFNSNVNKPGALKNAKSPPLNVTQLPFNREAASH